MMTRAHLQNTGPAIFMILVLLTGCRSSTTPVEFYTLTPLTAVSEADSTVGQTGTIAIGVGPLHIPKINDRPQIVTRSGPNKVNIDEFHRWAGSVYEDILRVLTINLSLLLQSNLVAAYPWEDYFDPEYRVFMEIRQFDGQLGQYALLDLTWTITGREAREVLLVRRSVIKEPVQGVDFDAFVAAKSRIMAALSRQIAQGIKEIHAGN